MTRATGQDFDGAVAALRSDPYAPPPWLLGGHRQTVFSAMWPRRPLPPAEELWVEAAPGERLRCDAHFGFRPEAHVAGVTGRGSAPEGTTLVIVHGMTGSSASGPAVDLAHSGLALGLDVVRMNMRGCGGTEAHAPGLYHANRYEDVLAVVRHLIGRRVRRLVLAGYSVGANLVLNFLGNLGDQVPEEVRAAFAICPAIDVNRCVSLVDERPENIVYRVHFVRALRGYYERMSRLYPLRFPAGRMRGVTTLRAFDAMASAPDAGFSDVESFYRWVSATPRLARIAVPTLVLHAADDPVVELGAGTRDALREAPAVRFVEMKSGGHCGFLERPSPQRPDGRWAAYQASRYALRVAG
jgi:uncharacterized protein